MKKCLLLFFAIVLLSGCQDKGSNLVFDVAMNCYVKVYEFADGTRVYSIYSDIKYKTDDTEISIQSALDEKILKLSDLEDNDNFKIFKPNEEKCLTCCG